MAIIEGMDGNGKRKSLNVLFLPPVVTVPFLLSQSVRGTRECPRAAQAIKFE